MIPTQAFSTQAPILSLGGAQQHPKTLSSRVFTSQVFAILMLFALACPTKGLEFDQRTLELIDSDKDGRVRVPEILGAVDWALARLANPDSLLAGAEALPLAAIASARPEGQAVLASARQILVAQKLP